MGKVEGSLQPVHYNAFDFEETKARTLHNSSGNKKGRLHLLTYDGIKGGDRHAVVAERVTFDPGKEKLGIWDRQFNILMQDDGGTWYKINKNSFIKRMNPSENLIVDEKGICTNIGQIIKARSEALAKLQAKSNAATPFEHEFLHQLSLGNDANHYKAILFNPTDVPFDKDPVLVITYEKGSTVKHGVRVQVSHSDYKKILAGHSISRSLQSMIKDEPIGLPEGELLVGNTGKTLMFDSKTRPSDIERYLSDQNVKFKIKTKIHLAKGIVEEKITADIDEDVDLDQLNIRPTKSYSSRIKDVPTFVERMKTVLNKVTFNV